MAKKAVGPLTDVDMGNGPENTAPTPKPARKPRTPKVIGPQWFTAYMSDGKYRIIQHVSPEAVASLIVTVTPTTPEDFVKAGRDDVTLEPYSVQSTTE